MTKSQKILHGARVFTKSTGKNFWNFSNYHSYDSLYQHLLDKGFSPEEYTINTYSYTLDENKRQVIGDIYLLEDKEGLPVRKREPIPTFSGEPDTYRDPLDDLFLHYPQPPRKQDLRKKKKEETSFLKSFLREIYNYLLYTIQILLLVALLKSIFNL